MTEDKELRKYMTAEERDLEHKNYLCEIVDFTYDSLIMELHTEILVNIMPHLKAIKQIIRDAHI